MKASIIISSHNRLNLLRRTLYSIIHNQPHLTFEVVLADDGSEEDIVGELRKYNGVFPWKFIKVDNSILEKETGLKHFFNNPAHTNNVAFRHSIGEYIFLMGNDIIAYNGAFNRLLNERPTNKHYIVFSTTLSLTEEMTDSLDKYGTNLDKRYIDESSCYILNGVNYHADVTNYLSLCPRATWEAIGGYDERYICGISCDDSDFVRRCRKLEDFIVIRSDKAISLHQYHGGKQRFYEPKSEVIEKSRFETGVKLNRQFYDNWNGQAYNPQNWDWGKIGVIDVVTG